MAKHRRAARGHRVAARSALQQVLGCCCFQLLVLLDKIKFVYVTKAVKRHTILLFNFDETVKSCAKIA